MKLFGIFLNQLRRKVGEERVFLFMDNLKVHRGSDVVPLYEPLKFDPIYNVKYMPDFMPIEFCFA